MLLPWLGALAIGLALGLLGSGGSILTVPVLVYLLGQDEKSAIAGSLLVVGVIATSGGLQHAWRRSVDWRSVLYFGLPGMAGTYGGAWLGGRVSGALQLAVFAIVMLLAAALMLRPSPKLDPAASSITRRAPGKVVLDGLAVGLLTGFVGVGGGFLIVPALVLLSGLSMHLAVGTSLVIIALKSFTGFFKYLEVLQDLGLSLDWNILLLLCVIGVFGSLLGQRLGHHVPQLVLQRLFAIFLLLIGSLILYQNIGTLI